MGKFPGKGGKIKKLVANWALWNYLPCVDLAKKHANWHEGCFPLVGFAGRYKNKHCNGR
jgi:hypothetical protein